MHNLSSLDFGIIGGYFAILLVVGFALSRRASASLEDYFLGGRRLPWWALGISGMASNLDVTGTMLIVSFLYMLGPRGIFIEFRGGVVLILAVMLLWTGKWHHRSRCMTGAEWMIYRFGDGIGGNFARIVTALATIIGIVASLAYLIKGVGQFLIFFLPFEPWVCALILLGVATVYTMLSGFYGVVYTDVIQSAIILIGVICITVMAVIAIADYHSPIGELAQHVTGNAQWISGVPHWHTTMPKGEKYEEYGFLAMFAFFYLFRNVLAGMGMGADPKYFGAPNERSCGMLTFLWAWVLAMRWPMMMGFAVLGLFLVQGLFPDQKALSQSAAAIHQRLGEPETGEVKEQDWPGKITAITNSPAEYPALVSELKDNLGPDWPAKLKLLSHDGSVNPERILPAVVAFKVPWGLRGLLFVALLAASMSTFDTGVNQSAAYFTRDIYQRYWRPTAPNRELVLITYVYIVAIVGGGFALAYSATSINDIWEWIIMGLGGGLLVPGLLKFYWWRFNAGGVVIGTLFGIVGAVADRISRSVAPETGYHVYIEHLFPATFPTALVGFVYLVVIGLIGAILGTYLTGPTPAKELEHFYRTTRPFGLWGPLKRRLEPQLRRQMTREHINDLVALPFTLGWQVTLFLLPMLLIVRNWQAAGVTAAIFVVCLIGMYIFWYRNLPPATVGDFASGAGPGFARATPPRQ